MIKIATNKFFLITVSLLCLCILCLGICIIPSILPPTPPPPEEEAWPSWAPDGRSLAYVCYLEGPIEGRSQFEITFDINYPRPAAPWSQYTAEAADICIINVDGHNRKRLTQELGKEWGPVWSPDGSRIAYLRLDGIYIINVDGSNKHRLAEGQVAYEQRYGVDKAHIAWSPDGNQVLFSACLKNLDADVYLVNVNNGMIINLTPNSRKHDVEPRWTFDGSKILFLSTASSVWPGTCGLTNDAPHQIKVINADGSNERVIYKELYYPFIAVSNTGQITFVSDMVSETANEYWDNNYYRIPASLYTMRIDDLEPVEVLDATQGKLRLILYSWSPDEKHLLYRDESRKFKILNIEEREARELPSVESLFDVEAYPELGHFSWSPNGQQIAATVYLTKGGDEDGGDNYTYLEKYIYIFNLQDDIISPLIEK